MPAGQVVLAECGFDNPEGRGSLISMRAVAIEQFTVADYRAMPEGPPHCQLVEGELILAPSPSSFHQEIAGNIYFLLRQHVVKHRLGKVCLAPLDVYLSETNVFQPDVFFSVQRQPALPPGRRRAWRA